MDRREALQRAGLVLGYAISAPVLAGIMNGCKAVPELTYKPVFFTEDQARIVGEVAEIIIPKTDTPGAKDVGIPSFVDTLLKQCYKKEDQDRFLAGLQAFDEASRKTYGDSFMDLELAQQQELVKKIHDEAIAELKAFDQIKRSLIGNQYVAPFSLEIVAKYGAPETPMDTVPNTDKNKWVEYFPKGNFTLEMDKSTSNIVEVSHKRPFILLLKELTVVGFFTSEPGATQVLQYEAVPGAYHGCLPLAEVGKTWATS